MYPINFFAVDLRMGAEFTTTRPDKIQSQKSNGKEKGRGQEECTQGTETNTQRYMSATC